MSKLRVEIGDSVLAKTDISKVFRMGNVVGIFGDTAQVRWNEDNSSSNVPLTLETMEVLSTTRKRKERFNMDDEENAYREAVGLKKKSRPAPQPVEKKLTLRITRTIDEENEKLERLTDSSLKKYLDVLRPFISSKVYERISNCRCKNVEIAPVTYSQPPEISNVVMRQYQIQGLAWLVDNYAKGINSILADEMGLGKTLQTISFFVHLNYSMAHEPIYGRRAHLVVVPLSVLFNWAMELRRFCPQLRALRVHTNSAKEQQRLRQILSTFSNTSQRPQYDVVITTYEMVKGKMENSFRRVMWRSMVLDEGHRIKNEMTDIYRACMLFKARFKLVLTGTPVQNNLHETFALLRFLHPSVFNTSVGFDDAFKFDGNNIAVDAKLLNEAHYLLRPFVLRRVKSEVEETLPPKLETIIMCPLSPMQIFWSKRLLLKGSVMLKQLEALHENKSAKMSGSAWTQLQSLLAQLRKAANHPYLFPGAEMIDPSDPKPQASEDIITASGKMLMLDRLLPKLKASGHRVVMFSQYTRVLDILSDYLHMRGYIHTRLDGSTHRVNREVRITQFNKPGSETFVFLLSTRAGGEGVNLFTADTVILFDSDWNPQVDIQAIARVHRIGQTRTVHTYRLVTCGSVEERIVQRAQKKLFLDSMVNRGSTSNAMRLDQLKQDKSASADNDEESTYEQTEEALSTMMSALKFGFGSLMASRYLSGDEMPTEDIVSDEMLNHIMDRSRGLTSATSSEPNSITPVGIKQLSSSEQDDGSENSLLLLQSVEQDAASFRRDMSLPMTSLRCLAGEYIPKIEDSCMSSDSTIPSNLRDIAMQWTLEKNKRVSKSRIETVRVKNVGNVSVLKINDYSIDGGEPSVFDRELMRRDGSDWGKERKCKKGVIEHQDVCQHCWDGGTLMCCTYCPAAYHPQCVGLPSVVTYQWSCPHHKGCVACGKSNSAMGFSFRCEVCSHVYCEDCLPEAEIVGECSRWEEIGFKTPSNCCFIRCSKACCEYIAYINAENVK